MPLNLVVFRYYHWLVYAFLIKAWYELKGERVLFVTKRSGFRILAKSGLKHNEDFIAFGEVAALLETMPGAPVNVIMHHHPSSVAEWDQVVPKGTNNLSISFYADGYTNRLMGDADISVFLETIPAVARRHMFFVPVPQPRGGAHLGTFERVTLPFEYLDHLFKFPPFLAAAEQAIARIVKFAARKPLLIAVLRPWGSTTFAKGIVEFENPEDQFAQIILSTVAAIEADQGNEFALLVRPDSRSQEFMDNTLVTLAHRLGRRKFLDLNSVWPDYLPLEPLLGNLARSVVGSGFVVSSFDSTASIPFIALGMGACHYIGSPETVVRQFAESGPSLDFLTARMAMLKGFVNDIARNHPVTIDNFDDMFLAARRRGDTGSDQANAAVSSP